MTLLPVDHHRVVGRKGPAYKVGPRCCNPHCRKIAAHAHHLWRRSEIIKDYDWVEVDGWIVAGKVGVCADCHSYLTENKQAIRLDEQAKTFSWCVVTGSKPSLEYHDVGLIEPQPPTPELLATLAPDQGTGSEESCPFCGQLKRRRRRTGALRRRRKSWLVKVPADAEEDGAAVLDALVENIAPLVPNADTSTTGRYYVLVPVLAYATMNAKNFVETMEGVGG